MNLNPKMAYFLGLMCGDGYVSPKGTIEIKTHEKEFLEDVYCKLIHNLFKLKPKVKIETKIMDGKKFSYYRSYFHSIKTIRLLKSFGIQSPKTYSVKVPEQIKKSSDKIMTSFLRGVFDTDGSIYTKINKNIINYPTISLESRSFIFINDIEALMKKIGLNVKKITYDKRGKSAFLLRIYGFKELKIYMTLISFSHPIKLKKANKVLNDGIKVGR